MYENGAMTGMYEERKKSFIKSASLVLGYGLYGDKTVQLLLCTFSLHLSRKWKGFPSKLSYFKTT